MFNYIQLTTQYTTTEKGTCAQHSLTYAYKKVNINM